ncbi:MAG TPA: TAT-variant-translocated molybdopterin oxidoreductase [Pyrinomonadaceae bacterium]|jgi:molybdopterin-containing oxidoreductase family iron-sulfur binding subunit
MRQRILAEQEGKQYWRSLEELADSPEFQEFVEREYPQHAEEWHDPVGRRTFLKLMGASLALAGLSSCTYQPPEKIVPYVRQPEELVPGKPLFFATAMPLGGVAMPLLAKSNEGRPTKLEGNPDHPSNRSEDPNDPGSSGTDIYSQASILTLYDPDRSQTLTYREEIRPWTAFVADMRTALDQERTRGGAGLRFLTETVSSPTLGAQMAAILRAFPGAKWHQYEPAARNGAMAGAMQAFGQPVNTLYRFDLAERIFSIDADFLSCGPGNVRYARDFASRRRVTEERRTMNRLYVVESTPSNTGAKADHKLPVRPSEIEAFARAVAAALTAAGAPVTMSAPAAGAPVYTAHAEWIAALARDLSAFRGASIVIAGDEQPAAVHALAHAMNAALGNVGKTVIYTEPIEVNPVDHLQSLRELVSDIESGAVQTLVILGGNPVYNAPADLKLDKARLDKVKLRVHLSLYKDETSELCHWHVPEAHYLESWSDARAFDGTVSIIQPLIMPLYNGRTAHELLAIFLDEFDRNGYNIVRDYWQGQMGGGQTTTAAGAAGQSAGQTTGQAAGAGNQGAAFANKPIITAPIPNGSTDFEAAWRKVLHDGFIPNTAARPREGLAIQTGGNAAAPVPAPQPPAPGQMEIVFRNDPSIYDGRFANNGWLQELPKPLNKLTWDNVAMMSPATARRLGVATKVGQYGGNVFADVVRLEYGGGAVDAPVWLTPGQPDDVITVHLGYGRRLAGRVGNGAGFNAYALRTSNAPWAGSGVKVTPTGAQYSLSTTQIHYLMENRDIVRSMTLKDLLENPDKAHEEEHESTYDESMYPPYDYKSKPYAWGMAIDVSTCVGCNACIVACQSENNIPVVGKEQVGRSREMHWLRVDSYFKGDDTANPEGPYFMPVPCMHCEQAPCEPVCPVHATVHSAEGTNDMVYNRCVGTRYCSNNCPYKVRRFNFLLYQDWNTPTYQLMRNPDVTVRSRGVMEKCTYCIQRIQWGKIEAEKENREVRDGEVVTACQSACPTDAIVFGNINDPKSHVSRLKAEERNYSLLADLNTQPRTTYLSAVRNPNPEIAEKA